MIGCFSVNNKANVISMASISYETTARVFTQILEDVKALSEDTIYLGNLLDCLLMNVVKGLSEVHKLT